MLFYYFFPQRYPLTATIADVILTLVPEEIDGMVWRWDSTSKIHQKIWLEAY
jgi:hypothetical protein